MIKNYFKIAWRNLVGSKAFSFINISGLSLGLACSLLIMLWVRDERKIDNFHVNGKNLYQVYERNHYDGKVDASYATQGLLAEELKRVVPEVQYASGYEYAAPPGTQNNFEADNKVGKMTGMYAGEDFFRMFSYPLMNGDPASSLRTPGSIAISKKMAAYFFGGIGQAIGKTIRFENKEDLQVTAIFDNLPRQSSQQFDFLRSWTDFVKQNPWVNNWGNTSPATYIQLREGTNTASVSQKIKEFIYRYQQKVPGSYTELDLISYPEKYLHSSFKNGYVDGGRIEYVRLFSIVAVFILLIACINFMNLATARSAKRAREVGVRKVIGARRSALIMQFVGEAFLLTFFAVMIAVVLTVILLPFFSQVTGKELQMPFDQPVFYAVVAGLILVTGLVAGSYPAFFLSSLKPVSVLKGKLKFTWSSVILRKGLVIFQFSLSIILIVGMIVIYRQMQYVQTKNLGYNRDNLIYLPIEGEMIKNYGVFKDLVKKEISITSVSKMRNSPTLIAHHTGSIEWPGKDPGQVISFADAVVGYDFASTMKLTLKKGRDFSKEYGNDSASYLLNETAVKKMGLKDPVGQVISWGNRKGTVIGVLQDFHFNSMHEKIEPLIIRLDENWGWGTILVRTTAAETGNAIASLEKIWKSLNPKFPFTYQFSDTEYARLYQSEQVVSKLTNIFAFLAIFISCLGLFGLATFTAEQRNKEIGVRKVLGASVTGIVSLLSANFLKPVFCAMLIAFPLAWWIMNQWLADFAYKINVTWWMFAAAGLLIIVIALLTVFYQSIRAALTNPVKALRTE